MFFNACESARLRSRRDAREAGRSRSRIESNTERLRRVQAAASMAEAFLRGGLASFIGTYWPVGDLAASTFATTLYDALLQGTTMNDAIQRARKAVRDAGSRDWTNYLYYGDPDFVLKQPTHERAEAVEIDIGGGVDVEV